MEKIMKTLIVVFVCAPFLCTQVYGVPTAEEVATEWVKNYGSIKDYNVAYTETFLETSELIEPNSPANWYSFLRIDTKVRRDGCYNTKLYMTIKDTNFAYHYIFDGIDQCVFLLEGSGKDNTPTVFLNGENIYASMKDRDSFKDALLTRTSSRGQTLLEFYLTFRNPDRDVRVRPAFETISGVECVVLEFFVPANKENPYAIGWFAHEKGMLVMKWMQFSRIDLTVYEIASNKNGLWYPRRAVRNDGEGTIFKKCTREIVIEDFVPDSNFPDSVFKCDISPGTRVYDQRIGVEYVK